MSLKIELVERAAKGETVASLCREFGISRQAGHKWINRFKELGYDGLDEKSRRPTSAPLATAEDIVMAVLEARERHPRWGPRKLVTVLQRKHGAQTPSTKTIGRILKRANKVRERRKRGPINIVERAPIVDAKQANDVWSVDFKGWWRAVDGERCEPLTVRDAFSRFVLAIVICRPTLEAVREQFERLFTRHGLPNAIQCDNGVPFVSVQARGGLSRLSAWWVSLGIRIVRSRPGCPQDNGAHERMHADVRADIQSSPGATVEIEQRRLDRWRQEFNRIRPHEALGNKTPADVYIVKERRRFATASPRYPSHFFVQRVFRNGACSFRNDKCFIGTALAGFDIGLEVVDAMRARVWFYDVDLGLVETMPDVDIALFDRPLGKRRVA